MLSGRRRRQSVILAALAVVGVVFGVLSFNARLFDPSLQAVTYDTFISNAPARISNLVTIVAMDDATITRYGRYPLPRQAFVDLLNTIKPMAPRTVALDVGFYDDSPNLDQDRALAVAIKDSGNVVLAMQGAGASVGVDGAIRFTSEQLPIAALRQAAAALGAVNIQPDADGRVRTAALAVDTPSGHYYSLPLVATARALLAAKFSAGDETSIRRQGDRLVLPARAGVPDRTMPISEVGFMPIYYASPPATPLGARPPGSAQCADPAEFCVVSLADVVAGTVPRALIANRLVMVGAHSISAVADDYPTPSSGGTKMYGVEIWANTASSIFTNRYPELREGLLLTAVQLTVATLGGILLVARFRLYGFLGAIIALAGYGLARSYAFHQASLGSVGDGPIAVASLGYLAPVAFWWVVALGYLLVEEETSVRRTRATFGRFVTPSIARTIMDIEERGRLALGGEEKRVTVLFGDIRGFTTMSEGMTPHVLLDTLNRYFEGIVNIVDRFEGTVNKFNGDNIMVIWGAPLVVQDQARKAVEAALEIQRWIVAERGSGGPDVSFGFGINTGPVVAGFLGALGRMEYTVIGDTANVASRLTANDIARRDQVVVSAQTLSELGTDVASVDLGAILVKGRAEPIRCYQVDRIGAIQNPNPAAAPERPKVAATAAGTH